MIEAESTGFATEEGRWRALVGRDVRAVGAFVYAVRTTGIYCLPACRSRRPDRGNVAFFDHADAAERAGFRACLRCRPRSPRPDDHGRAIVDACRAIEGSEGAPGLAGLAASAGIGPGQFRRLFRRMVGLSPREYASAVRAERLRVALPGAPSVAGAIFGAGFSSIGRAYQGAAGELGMTPAEYRGGGDGRSIRFASVGSSLGWITAATTDLGLCSIELGDSREDLEARLLARFPEAALVEDDPDFAGRLGRVVALVEGPGAGTDLPLDVRGTAFQRLVWDALRAIPAGSTATYAEVARAIGRPSSARAVARACASNGLAVVIPCHRVVRGDGGLGGYRWGVGRKRALLDAESGAGTGPEPVPPGGPED